MNIGKYEVRILNSGFLSLDGGGMFGIIPKNLWERTNPADEKNRVKLATRHILLKSPGENILIDTGMGDKWDIKSINIYNIENTPGIIRAIHEEGLTPQDIHKVILTHFHFDHTGGSTIKANGKLLPTFPNAKYYVQREHYTWAMKGSDKDRKSFINANYLPLFEEGVIDLIEGNTRFNDEIELIKVNGHTMGMQLVKISDSSYSLVHCADLIPFVSHVQLSYIMSYDIQPLVTFEEKKEMLKKAVEENWFLFFEHDPIVPVATVELTEKGFAVKERILSENGRLQTIVQNKRNSKK